MKCPECDLEQPDSATLCAGCGLSFEMWRQHNPEPAKTASVPPKEMAFPDPEEEEPAPQEKPAAEEPSSELPSEPTSETGASSSDLPPETASVESKGFKWTPLHWAGLGLAIVLALGAFYLIHRGATKPNPGPPQEKPPLLIPTTSTSATPINGTPAVLSPGGDLTQTPESTPTATSPDGQAVPAASNDGATSPDVSTPTVAPAGQETPIISTSAPVTSSDSAAAPVSTTTPDTPTNSTAVTVSPSPALKSAVPATPVNTSAEPSSAAVPGSPTDSTTLPASASSAPKSAIPGAAVTSPAPVASPDLLESSQAVPTATAIPVP